MTNAVQSVTKTTQPERKRNPKRVDRDGHYLGVRALDWYLMVEQHRKVSFVCGL